MRPTIVVAEEIRDRLVLRGTASLAVIVALVLSVRIAQAMPPPVVSPTITLFASDDIRSGRTVELHTAGTNVLVLDTGQGIESVNLRSMTMTMRSETMLSGAYQRFSILSCSARLGPVTAMGYTVDSASVFMDTPGTGAINATTGNLLQEMHVTVVPVGAPTFSARLYSSGYLTSSTVAVMRRDGGVIPDVPFASSVPGLSRPVAWCAIGILLLFGTVAIRRRRVV